jgi:hypothetical protein
MVLESILLLTEEYQEYFRGAGGSKGDRCVGLTTLPPSCADCLEILEPQSAGILRACTGIGRLVSLMIITAGYYYARIL